MSFAQFHDGFYRNPKVRAVEPAAAWMWTASIGYANENLTDGFIPKAALHDLAVIDAKPRAKLVEQLVAERLWEPCDGGWMIHDFLMWNPSKAAVLARRAANLARVNKHRDNAATHGDGNARVMRYNERTQRVSNPPPNASVPNALGDASHLLSPAPPEAPTTEAPKAPPPNPGETGALFDDPAPPPPPPAKPAPKRRASSKPKTDDPPPFSIDAAIDAIASAAGSRFEVGDKAAWDKGHIIATRKMIRHFPDLSTWSLVGEWLRAGGDAFRGPVTIEWTAEAHFSTAVMLAKRWHADGRPAITRNGAAPEPTPEQRRAALVAGADQRPTSTGYSEPPPRDYDPTAPEIITEAERARREYARTAGRAALLALRNPGAKVVNS